MEVLLKSLKDCAKNKDLHKGAALHSDILKRGLLERSHYLASALLNVYVKCGMLEVAQKMLDDLPSRDLVTWSAVIAGYGQHGKPDEAWSCFERMRTEGLSPDGVTFACVLKVCSETNAIQKGKEIHNEIVCRGILKNDIVLGNTLLVMYAKCGQVTEAENVFEDLLERDMVSWNALIAGYVQRNQDLQALNCFENMQNEGVCPDAVTFTSILKACASIGAIDTAKEIHKHIVSRHLLKKDTVLGTALVDMYVKCGVVATGQQVFEELPERNLVSWNALISGYTQQGNFRETLSCFEKMQSECLSPDVVTFICILKACGGAAAIEKGSRICNEVLHKSLLENNIMIGNAVVDMYVKCGALVKAQQVLEELPVRDAISWNSLIAGYAEQAKGYDALNCLEQMQLEGLSVDKDTLHCVLNACSHSGLLTEAEMLFWNMTNKYCVAPKLEHYTCMVAVFGCAGDFSKVISVIKAMPSFDHPVVWFTLLGACEKWGNVKLGILAFDQVVQTDNKNCTAAYVLMANILAYAGMHEDAEKVLKSGKYGRR